MQEVLKYIRLDRRSDEYGFGAGTHLALIKDLQQVMGNLYDKVIFQNVLMWIEVLNKE
jgi:hypothetical protein